jgi:hypothetical protein
MKRNLDIEKFDIKKFAENLAKAGREGVKWENRKLEWIRQEKAKQTQTKSEVA